MTPSDWERIQDIVDAALDMTPGERAAYLDARCAENRELRSRAGELIEAHDNAGGFLSAAIRERADEVLGTSSPADGAIDAIGQTISGYRILSKIGQGGMGFVLKAEDTVLKRQVALKFITPDWMENLAVNRLIREAKAASGLNHPNILTIHGVIQSESSVALVMELVDGVPLRNHCGAPLPVSEVIRIGRQIALALAAAHAAGIVHRDVKPENVMLRPDGYVKVLEFGLARDTTVLELSSGANFAAGALQYMAPEQIRAEKARAESDIFSLGLVLYEMLAGKHPFAAESALETAYAITHQNPLPPSALNPRLPAALDELILKMLAKNPSCRPSAQQVEARLGEIGQPFIQSPGRYF